MKLKLFLLAALALAPLSSYGVIYGVAEGAFSGFTHEDFQGPQTNITTTGNTYDFGNGMIYTDLGGGALINYNGGYGMGTNPSIFGGRGGYPDGYLGTYNTPASFSLSFAAGTNYFGFSGAESAVSDGSFGRDGFLAIEFYDAGAALLGSFNIDTNNVHAWSQWHGFQSSTAIASVKMNTVGHAVFDDVKFGAASVPDSGSVASLLVVALLGLAGVRRRMAS